MYPYSLFDDYFLPFALLPRSCGTAVRTPEPSMAHSGRVATPGGGASPVVRFPSDRHHPWVCWMTVEFDLVVQPRMGANLPAKP